MSEVRIEGTDITAHLDAEERYLPFLIDLVTPLPGSNPARPDSEDVIKRELASDCQANHVLLRELFSHSGVELQF